MPLPSSERFHMVVERIDQLNRQDPNRQTLQGADVPGELRYSQRLTECVSRLNPQASEELRIAARGQHVQRWTIPRDRFPRTRAGYLRWRETLKAFHAKTVGELMRETGYPASTIEHVQMIMSKQRLADDPDTQTLEDALCLVFLETQFADLRCKTPEATMLQVLRKTWRKMSEPARAIALQLPLGPEERALLARACSIDG